MSWLFGSSSISVDDARTQIYAKLNELAPRVIGYQDKDKQKDNARWLADQIGLRLETGSPAASPRLGPAPAPTAGLPLTRPRAASLAVATGGRRKKARKTRKLRR